jgi:hypothetical protein
LRYKRILCTLLAASLLLTGLVACGAVVPEDGAKAAEEMIAAALKSSAEELYYYKETQYAVRNGEGKVVMPPRYTEVDLWAATDKLGNRLYDTIGGDAVDTTDESGVPVTRFTPERKVLQDYKIKIYRKVNNRSDIEFISGLSKGGSQTADLTFFSQWDEKDKATRTLYNATRDEFAASSLFSQYSLSTKIAELAEIKPEEIDFSGSKAKLKRNGELFAMNFSIKPGYFERIGDKTSALRGSSHIEVECTYGRIQRLSIYKSASGWMKEEEVYTILIVYAGPKFDVPAFDSNDWKNIGITTELPSAV